MTHPDLTARIAYHLWESRGKTHGRHVEDWCLAEHIVTACLEVAAGRRKRAPRRTPRTRATAARGSVQARALDLLERSIGNLGRARVAADLGYSSTSSVGRLLRGDRPLSEDLAQRILTALAPTQPVLKVHSSRVA